MAVGEWGASSVGEEVVAISGGKRSPPHPGEVHERMLSGGLQLEVLGERLGSVDRRDRPVEVRR